MRPELLSVRAVNQYRRRDVLAYLGLRYYLENDSAQSNMWAEEVSTHLINTRALPIYFRSYHFKEMGENEKVVHRNIYLPGPNEAIAEAVLLNECSKYSAFKSSDRVFSYKFAEQNSKEGIFRSYFPGFRERHHSIAWHCQNLSGAKVLYTDIKKFYPSISQELALTAWGTACDSSRIAPAFRELGERLLSEHNNAAIAYKEEKVHILTGPMFSHLIANLVLTKVDNLMSQKTNGKYWRYVDDIVLVGDDDEVKNMRELLKDTLGDLGFSLHEEGKDFTVDSAIWLDGVNDFNDSESKAWMILIANIRRFLVAKSDERDQLVRAFSDNGINIPLLDYASAVMESTYLERLSDWLNYHWAAKSVRGLTVNGLVEQAIQARDIYQTGMNTLLNKNSEVEGYERKRLMPKLRFYAGRLIYLATPDMLSSISSNLNKYPELLIQSQVMNAIESRDISSLLKFGTNATQAAAQILRIQDDAVKCSLNTFDDIDLQGLAMLRINGIEIDFTDNVVDQTTADQLNQFALGTNPAELMKSNDPFMKEIACLCGIENPSRHKSLLNTAFDRDENLMFDIINQLHESSYF